MKAKYEKKINSKNVRENWNEIKKDWKGRTRGNKP
jgi:hypothetical protein